ncbi:MAG: hypothetical protein ACRDQ4_23310 [Pseudonocardiaceae bacterium]
MSKDLLLLHTTVDHEFDDVVTSGTPVIENLAEAQRSGRNLAAQCIAMLCQPDVIDRARQTPHPRVRALLDLLAAAETTYDDADDLRFILPSDSDRCGRRSDSGVIVRIDDGQPADATALGAALDHPPTLLSTGVTISVTGHLDFWLAGMTGFCRLLAGSQAVDRRLVAPAFGWGSMGVFDQGTFAYLTLSPTGETDASQWPRYELGVCAYGPGSGELANRVADRILAWEHDRQSSPQDRYESVGAPQARRHQEEGRQVDAHRGEEGAAEPARRDHQRDTEQAQR